MAALWIYVVGVEFNGELCGCFGCCCGRGCVLLFQAQESPAAKMSRTIRVFDDVHLSESKSQIQDAHRMTNVAR